MASRKDIFGNKRAVKVDLEVLKDLGLYRDFAVDCPNLEIGKTPTKAAKPNHVDLLCSISSYSDEILVASKEANSEIDDQESGFIVFFPKYGIVWMMRLWD